MLLLTKEIDLQKAAWWWCLEQPSSRTSSHYNYTVTGPLLAYHRIDLHKANVRNRALEMNMRGMFPCCTPEIYQQKRTFLCRRYANYPILPWPEVILTCLLIRPTSWFAGGYRIFGSSWWKHIIWSLGQKMVDIMDRSDCEGITTGSSSVPGSKKTGNYQLTKLIYWLSATKMQSMSLWIWSARNVDVARLADTIDWLVMKLNRTFAQRIDNQHDIR